MAFFAIFSVSYAVLKKAPKSTKSTDDDEHEPKSVRHKENPEYLIIPEKEAKLPEKNENEDGSTEDAKDEGVTPIVLAPQQVRDAHSEECQRIIDKAFGTEVVEPVLSEQYFSVNHMKDTRQAITKAELAKLQFTAESLQEQMVPDQRVQFGLYKSVDPNVEECTTEPDAVIIKDNTLITSTDADTTQAQHEPANLQKPVDEQLGFLQQSLRALPAEEGNSELSERVRNAHTGVAKENKPLSEYLSVFKNASFGKDPFEPYIAENSPSNNSERVKEHNLKSIYLNKTDISGSEYNSQVHGPNENPNSMTLGFDNNPGRKGNRTQGDIENIGQAHTLLSNAQTEDAAIPYNFEGMHLKEYCVRATTAKEAEEQLTQKIENIEETPLVEAHTPKVEGFSITPKVLGQTNDSIDNYCDKNLNNPEASPGIDTSASYDEVAKRCLDTPTSQIDEILLKEMEKLGIPITGHRDSGIRLPVCENDLVQMDVIKKPRRPVEKKDIDLESHECERGAVDLCENEEEDNMTLNYPILLINKESVLPDFDEEALMQLVELIKNEQVKCERLEEEAEEAVDTMHPNQVLIDPYDKKTIARDTGEFDPEEWKDPKRGYAHILPYYNTAKSEPVRPTVVAKAKVAAEVLEEKSAQKTPAMSPNHFAWFSENTNRCLRRNLTFDETAMSERRLILSHAQKALYENNLASRENNDSNMDMYKAKDLGPKQDINYSRMTGRQMIVDEAQKRLFEYKENREAYSKYMNMSKATGVERNDSAAEASLTGELLLNEAQKGLHDNEEKHTYGKYMEMCNPSRFERNLSAEESRTTEPQLLLSESQKRLYENYEKAESGMDTYSKYMDMCDPSGFWRHQYAQGSKEQNAQPNYIYTNLKKPSDMWQNDQSRQGYQPGSQTDNKYDYTNNPYLQNPKAPQSEFTNMIVNTAQSEGITGSDQPITPLLGKMSAGATRLPAGDAYASRQVPCYLSKSLNTSDNSFNIKETLRISERMKEPSNINEVEKALNIKPSTTIPEKLAHKVKSIALPPPTYRIYKHMSKTHPKPPQRARPLKPMPLSPQIFQASHRAHSSRNEVLDRKRSRTAKDWRRAIDPPAPLTHAQFSQPTAEIVEDLSYENKPPLTVAQGPNFKYKTYANESDEVWDAEGDDRPPTEKYARANYTKNVAAQAQPASEAVEASTHAVKKSIAQEIWDNEQLDPKHVLTCNETCPIALRSSTIEPSEANRLKAIYDQDFTKADLRKDSRYNMRKFSPNMNVDRLPDFEALPNTEGQANMGNVPNVMHADACLSPELSDTQTFNASAATMPESFTEPDLAPRHSPKTHAGASPVQISECPSLPKLNEDVSLSELLRRVRLRNKLLEQQEKNKGAVEATMSKCPKAPRCPPTAPRAPPNHPVVMPPFALPMLKPRPRSCPPRKKPKSAKFSTCDLDVDSGLPLGSHATIACPEMVCEMNGVGTFDLAPNGKMTVADLTDDIIERLHNLGKLLGGIWRGSKLVLAKDYDPWIPIPSWPSKKKPTNDSKKPSRCDPGCKSYPPTRSEHDPPCEQKPCIFPRKHFSLLDCFAVSIGDHKVYNFSEY